MKFTFHSLHELLSRWAKREYRLPERHVAMKAEILNHLPLRVQADRPPARAWSPSDWRAGQSPRRMPWFALAGVGVAVFVIVLGNDLRSSRDTSISSMTGSETYQADSSNDGSSAALGASPDAKKNMADDTFALEEYGSRAGLHGAAAPSAVDKMQTIFYPPQENTPITDTREFLKIGYHARIQTRQIEETGDWIATMVRGYGGRVDKVSLQERNGYITFVIPKTAYESFTDQVKSHVKPRFFQSGTEQQNLLGQKISIETDTANTETRISTLQTNRQRLVTEHQTTIASLNRQLTNTKQQIAVLDEELKNKPQEAELIMVRKKPLVAKKTSLESNIYQENRRYNQDLQNIDYELATEESRLRSLEQQDQNLIDTVETVEGSISLQWISLAAITKSYLVDYWYWLLLLIPVAYLFRNRPRVLELP